MKLLIAEALISAVYVFDVSTYPFMHISFYLLTSLYFASILEVYGFFRIARSVARRIGRLQQQQQRQHGSVSGYTPSHLLALR